MGPETESELELDVAAEEAPALELDEPKPPKPRPMTERRLAAVFAQVGGQHPVQDAIARAAVVADSPASEEVATSRKSKAERRTERLRESDND